jgi:hypothetical protein
VAYDFPQHSMAMQQALLALALLALAMVSICKAGRGSTHCSELLVAVLTKGIPSRYVPSQRDDFVPLLHLRPAAVATPAAAVLISQRLAALRCVRWPLRLETT